MPILFRIVEHDRANVDAIQTAIRFDRDLLFDGIAADVRSLANAEIAIVNLRFLAPYDIERLHLIGAPPGIALITIVASQEQIEQVRDNSVAVLRSPLSVAEVSRALQIAKDAVLATRVESLSSLLTAYRSADVRTVGPDLPRAESIQWIESDGNYVKVHADDGTHTLRMTMAHAEDQFRGTDIVRAHRKWLVNLARISGIRSSADGAIHLRLPSSEELVVGRAYRDDVRRRLGLRGGDVGVVETAISRG